jgi:hypothetical protein
MEGEDPPLQTQIEFSNSEAASSSTSEDEPLTESGEDSADD